MYKRHFQFSRDTLSLYVSDTNYIFMILDKNSLFVMSGEVGMSEEVRTEMNIFIGIPFL